MAIGVVIFPWALAQPTTYDALDPKLVFVSAAPGASADLSGSRGVLTATQGARVRVDVLTTLDDFSAELSTVVQKDDSTMPSNTDATPFEARFWYPASNTSINLRFAPGGRRQIIGSIFDGHEERLVTILGTYQVGSTYRLFMDWHKGSSASFRLVFPNTASVNYTVDRTSGLKLFDERFVNLSIDSISAGGEQRAEVSAFNFTVPPQTAFSSKASDLRLLVVTAAIVVWFVAYLAYQLWAGWNSRVGRQPSIERRNRAPLNTTVILRTIAIGVAGLVLVVAAYALLAPVDGLPYDRLAQESYAYVSDQYGLAALYERTAYIPDAAVRGGYAPWSNPPFAYPPAMAYPYWIIGHAWELIRGPISPMHDRSFQAFWKLAFSLFVLVNAGVIFAIFKSARGTLWALFGVAVYALNPAIVFDAAGWGETEAIVTSALLISAFGFVTGKPRLGWSAVIVGALIKQTALFAVPIMAIYSLKRYGVRQSLIGGATGLLVGFSIVSPLIFIGYHPATIYRSVVAQLLNFANPVSSYASTDTFSVWTLVTWVQGLHGFDRIWAPYPLMLGGIKFSTLGSVGFLATMLVLLWTLWGIRPANLTNEPLFLAIAAVLCAYVAFSTVASARYLLLALPFLILGLINSAAGTRLWMIGGLTAIAFISMYGVLMEIAVRGDWPVYFGLGNPSTNSFSHAAYQLYTSDAVITVLALVLLLILEVLLVRLGSFAGRDTLVLKRDMTPLTQS
jgi:hypothetical protein